MWNYPEADEASLIAGLAYVNIHSANFLSGEIRGQILRDNSPASLAAAIDGTQEAPANASPATGTGFFKVDTLANTLAFNVTYANLTGAETGSHIHGPAESGQNGTIQFSLPPGFHKVGVWNYPEALEPAILAGQMYVNIHSTNFQAGEIRGQMLVSCVNRTKTAL